MYKLSARAGSGVPCKLNNEKHDKHLGQFDLIKLFIECLR